MSTVIRTTLHPDGYIDFLMGEEIISCAPGIETLTAQQLYDACLEAEDDQLAIGFEGIADGEGKNPSIGNALNVQLLRNWLVQSEGTRILVDGGNVTNEVTGRFIFVAQPGVQQVNQMAQFGMESRGADLDLVLAAVCNRIHGTPQPDGSTNVELYSADGAKVLRTLNISADELDRTVVS